MTGMPCKGTCIVVEDVLQVLFYMFATATFGLALHEIIPHGLLQLPQGAAWVIVLFDVLEGGSFIILLK